MEEEMILANEGYSPPAACEHIWEKLASSMAESQYKCIICGEEDWR